MTIPVKRLNNGVTDYFPMSVLDAVFLNKSVTVNNTVGGLKKGSTVLKNTSLQTIIEKILSNIGPDYQSQIDNKVDKVEGKGLSTCDFLPEYRTKLENAITQHQDISGKVDKVEGKGLSTNDFTDIYRNKLINAVTRQDISGKVDKEEGKGLSSENYTKGEKIKLSNLVNYDDSELRRLIDAKLNSNDVLEKISQTSNKPVQSKVLYSLLTDIKIRLANLEALFMPHDNYIAADVTIVNDVGNSTVVLECDEINLDTTEEE